MADSWGTLGYFLVLPQHDLTQHKRAVKPVPCTVPLHWAEPPDMSEAHLEAVILQALSGCNEVTSQGGCPACCTQQCLARLCRDRDRGCKDLLCRLQKEQKHAKAITLRFLQAHLASLPPSSCTAICKSSLSCSAGPSCAPLSSLPWAGQVCAPPQSWKPRSEHCRQVGGVQERTTPGCRELTATQTAKVVYSFKHPLLGH